MERWEEKENRKFLRAGTIAAAAVNPHLDYNKTRAYTPHTFFSWLPKPEPKKPSPSVIRANAEHVFKIVNVRHQKLEARKRRAAGGASSQP